MLLTSCALLTGLVSLALLGLWAVIPVVTSLIVTQSVMSVALRERRDSLHVPTDPIASVLSHGYLISCEMLLHIDWTCWVN